MPARHAWLSTWIPEACCVHRGTRRRVTADLDRIAGARERCRRAVDLHSMHAGRVAAGHDQHPCPHLLASLLCTVWMAELLMHVHS